MTTADVVANANACGDPSLILKPMFVDDATQLIDDALFSSMFLSIIAVGSVGVELVLTVVLYFVCRSCFAEKVAELELGIPDLEGPRQKENEVEHPGIQMADVEHANDPQDPAQHVNYAYATDALLGANEMQEQPVYYQSHYEEQDDQVQRIN